MHDVMTGSFRSYDSSRSVGLEENRIWEFETAEGQLNSEWIYEDIDFQKK